MFPTGLIVEVARRAGRSLSPMPGASGEYVIQCIWPQRHQHGDVHASCRLNPEKNTWYCDPCGRGGGVVDFAQALGVDLDQLGAETAVATPAATRTPRARRPEPHFVSTGPISESTRRRLARQLGKDYTADTWRVVGVLEGAVNGRPAIAFPLQSGGFKVCLYEQPNTKQRKPYTFMFTDGGKADLLLVGDGPEVLLTAGEWDMLKALSAGIPCVATGTGGEGTWKREWSPRLAGTRVFVVYDVDEPGRRGAAKVAEALEGTAAAVINVALPLNGDLDGEGKDLSDYLALHPVEDLRTVLREAVSASAGIAGSTSVQAPVSELIDNILSMKGPVRLKRREAASLVIDDLRSRGELVRADGGRLFWFDRELAGLYDLDAFPFRTLFLRYYQVNPTEREFAHIFEAVKSVAREHGRHVQVCRFAFYDRDRNRLYVHGGSGMVLRLDGSNVVRVENGTDDVIFEDSETSTIPREAVNLPVAEDSIGRHIVDRVNFIRGAGVILSSDQQRLVLRVWILSVFFPELLPAKNLLLLYGEKGSGKTTTLRVILKLLLGPTANVTPLVNKEDGFNAAVTSEYLLVLDNVDSFSRWIEDRLATVATGQTIRLRKLYTTNEMLSFPTRCCIALTARTPRFRRDDVVDRLQILRVARLESFSKESDWYAEIEAHRAALWAQILRDLNSVVALLATATSDSPDTIRMADWASLATTIGESLGQGDAIRKALEASELDKAHFLLEADAVYDLLHGIAHDIPNREWKAAELFAELKHRAEGADMEFTIKSPRSLGRILHRLEPALKLMITFAITTSLHDGQAVYRLGPLPVIPNTPTRSAPAWVDDEDVDV